jgi:hypothetical protein
MGGRHPHDRSAGLAGERAGAPDLGGVKVDERARGHGFTLPATADLAVKRSLHRNIHGH